MKTTTATRILLAAALTQLLLTQAYSTISPWKINGNWIITGTKIAQETTAPFNITGLILFLGVCVVTGFVLMVRKKPEET